MSASITKERVKNRLLQCFSREVFDQIAPYLEPVDLPLRRYLVQARKPIEHVCFIESGLASVVAESEDGRSLEIRHIGFEGVAGYPIILGVDRTPDETFMQVAGSGLQIPTDRFLPVLEDPATRQLMLRYAHTCSLQLAHSALAAGKYSMPQRLARWLLMCHDRLEQDELPLTHEFLALMIGVRRSSVTDQLHILEGLHAIRATRGRIHVQSRNILLKLAGGSYGVPEEEYERLIGNADCLVG